MSMVSKNAGLNWFEVGYSFHIIAVEIGRFRRTSV